MPALGLALGLPYQRFFGSSGGGVPQQYPMGAAASAIYDFVNQRYYTRDAALNTAFSLTTDLSTLFSIAVDADGTHIGSNGLITQNVLNTPPYDYNPVTLAPLGLPILGARTNLLLNSLIDGTDLVTQDVTVAAVAHTLSFYGTGTITLSGVSTAGPLVGTGVYPNRVTLTFTPTAGTLTVTVTGSVKFGQLEAGTTATSFVPTAGASVNRAVYNLFRVLGTEFNATEDTIFVKGLNDVRVGNHFLVTLNNNNTTQEVAIRRATNAAQITTSVVDTTSQYGMNFVGITADNAVVKAALAFKANDFNAAVNGVLGTLDTSGTVPTLTQLQLGGQDNAVNPYGGHLQLLMLFPSRLTDSQLPAISA